MSDRPSAPAGMAQEPGFQPGQPHPHFLVQAPVPAVDADGIRVVSIGTALFAVASVVLGLFYPQLAAHGRGWWLAVCLSGAGLGLVGLLYCRNRIRTARRGPGPTAPSPTAPPAGRPRRR